LPPISKLFFTEFDKGPAEFAVELFHNGEIYFEEDRDHYRRSIVTKVYKQPSDLFDRHLYEKGSLVLHMLRGLLGARDFWKAIGVYVRDNKGRTVETRQLLDAIEKATGKNLSRFFDQWVYGAGPSGVQGSLLVEFPKKGSGGSGPSNPSDERGDGTVPCAH
jgi:aminopeptidase N